MVGLCAFFVSRKQNLELLTAFHETNGDANVPLTHEDKESGVALGRW
jgi:hypothetical protein